MYAGCLNYSQWQICHDAKMVPAAVQVHAAAGKGLRQVCIVHVVYWDLQQVLAEVCQTATRIDGRQIRTFVVFFEPHADVMSAKAQVMLTLSQGRLLLLL
jgi:hypothetical protein